MPMSPEHGEDRQTAYKQGASAQRDRKSRSHVPYEFGTLPHDDWQDGYSAAQVGTDQQIGDSVT